MKNNLFFKNIKKYFFTSSTPQKQPAKKNKKPAKTDYSKNIYEIFSGIITDLSYLELDFSNLSIKWGRNTKKRLKSVSLGSYSHSKKLIRIHPVLDGKFVPEFFIRSIIYHEIGHFIYFSYYPDSSTYHNKRFYSILKAIDLDFYKSKRWLEENKTRLFQE